MDSLESLLHLSPPASPSTVFSGFDGLQDLLSLSFFDDGSTQDFCFPLAAPAPPPSQLPSLEHDVACLPADENGCVNSNSGSPPCVQRRCLGYSLDDFNLINIGELSAPRISTAVTTTYAGTGIGTDKCTSTGCINGQPSAGISGRPSTAGADPAERAAMTKTRRMSCSPPVKAKHAQNMASESIRRKRMTRLFHTLRSLLPNNDILQSNRCCVIDETCRYIRDLEKKLRLFKLLRSNALYLTAEAEHLAQRITSDCGGKHDDHGCKIAENQEDSTQLMSGYNGVEAPYVKVTCVEETMVRIIVGGYERGPSPLFSTILHTVESKGLDVISANRSQMEDVVLYSIHARLYSSSKLDFGELEELIYFRATRILKDFGSSRSI